MKISGQKWLHRCLLKPLTTFMMVLVVGLTLSGCLFIYIRSHGVNNYVKKTVTFYLGHEALGDVKEHPNSWKKHHDNTEHHERDTGTFQSPFIVPNSGEMESDRRNKDTGLVNGSPAKERLKTFAVIWPCKGGPKNCFLNTRFPVHTCSFNTCRQTWNLEKADVVVFSVYRIRQNEVVPKFTRSRHQRWVMMTPEAPARGTEFAMLDLPALKGQFNWTLTYRLDSDIPNIYGKLQRMSENPEKNYEDIYLGKNVTAAWFVSNCDTPSNRQTYVQRMQTVADIHVYGRCGNYICHDDSETRRGLDKDQCLPMLSKTYFFYLAFENSLCKDYVTEKFFKLFEDTEVIPVVRGGADYKRYFPRDIFIDASDFKSPEDLAAFLLYLAKDKSKYLSMLKEKSRYRLRATQKWFCALCEKMNLDNTEKSYPDLREWYVRDQCREPDVV